MRPALERLDGLMLLAPRLIIMSQCYKWGVTTVWAREVGKIEEVSLSPVFFIEKTPVMLIVNDASNFSRPVKYDDFNQP